MNGTLICLWPQVVLKIVKHCKESLPALVTGQLLGLDIHVCRRKRVCCALQACVDCASMTRSCHRSRRDALARRIRMQRATCLRHAAPGTRRTSIQHDVECAPCRGLGAHVPPRMSTLYVHRTKLQSKLVPAVPFAPYTLRTGASALFDRSPSATSATSCSVRATSPNVSRSRTASRSRCAPRYVAVQHKPLHRSAARCRERRTAQRVAPQGDEAVEQDDGADYQIAMMRCLREVIPHRA
jgi:hypothetical protein